MSEVLLPDLVAQLKAQAEALEAERESAQVDLQLCEASVIDRRAAYSDVDGRYQRLWQAIRALSPTEG